MAGETAALAPARINSGYHWKKRAIDSININSASGGLVDQVAIDKLLGIAEAQESILRARAIHHPNDR